LSEYRYGAQASSVITSSYKLRQIIHALAILNEVERVRAAVAAEVERVRSVTAALAVADVAVAATEPRQVA